MPLLKLCTFAGCREIIRDGSSHRCPKHRSTKRSQDAATRASFYNQSRWKTLSLQIRSIHPVCELCQQDFSTDTDHHAELIVDPNHKYAFDSRNLVAMCKSCHYRKSNEFQKIYRTGDINKLYLWLINNHPRREDTDYLHEWISSYKESTC